MTRPSRAVRLRTGWERAHESALRTDLVARRGPVPSPVAHGSLALLVGAFAHRHPRLRTALDRPAFFYVGALATLWAADIDFLLRLLNAHPALEHGGATHSAAVGVFFGILFALACRAYYGTMAPFGPLLALGIVGAWLHPLMDMSTWRGGVMLLWPLSDERFATVPLFYGARHSELTAWRLHLITLFTELLFVAPVWWLARRVAPRRLPSGNASGRNGRR